MDETRDTIFALSTAPGRAGVAVIRISGPQAIETLSKITNSSLPTARHLVVRKLVDGDSVIDEAMVVWFNEGQSFTAEFVSELHLHGGQATVSKVLAILGVTEGLRPADPGEFTRRALENGRMDVLEVEALADLIDAETEEQRRQAIALMNGAASTQAKGWRESLVQAFSLLEASIDFADEEDAPLDVSEDVQMLLASVYADMSQAVQGSKVASRVRDGFRIALVGAPNAGKSTLMNALVKREAAITSSIAGTTRDVIEVAADFRGFPVLLQDMAGLRIAGDEVERIGVERAKATAAAADLRIFLESQDAKLDAIDVVDAKNDLRVWTKCDLYPSNERLAISSVTGIGLEQLVDEIVIRLGEGSTSSGLFGRERQINCLKDCLGCVDRAMCLEMPEMKVEELRKGIRSMNDLFGSVGTEEILGEIFSNFCIGK